MQITYNAVTLEAVRTNFVLRENIRTEDDGTYLYTKWTIDVVGQVSIQTSQQGQQTFPGTQDITIRNALMEPRQKLVVIAGGAQILQSPQPKPPGDNPNNYYATDAKNGPFCEVFAIRQIIGVSYFLIHARFTTYVNENTSAGSSNNPNVVLANRWTMVEDVDELAYPTRTVEGEAILRTDWMHYYDLQDREDGSPNFNADVLRGQFFFPVPANYQREKVRVELSSDGSRLRWSFVDISRCYNFGRGSIIRKIDAYQNFRAAGATPTNMLMRGLEAAFAMPGPSIDRAWLPPLMAWRGVRAVSKNLPTFNNQVRVDLWGDRDAPRNLLMQLALGVCIKQLGIVNNVITAGNIEIVARQALHEKFVSVEMTLRWSVDTNVFSTALNTVTGINSTINVFGASDTSLSSTLIPGNVTVLDQARGVQAGNYWTLNPSLSGNANDNSSHGNANLLVALVAQVLEEPNEVPPSPTIPMPAN